MAQSAAQKVTTPTIPIKNIYYLLCYAWDQLEQGALVDVDELPSTELVDLFAHVLCSGVHHLAKRGLEQGYELVSEELAGIRGRIDIGVSARRSLMMRGRLQCEFDELTSNTFANQILKTTLGALLKVPELEPTLKKAVHATYRDLRGIDTVKLTSKSFRTVRVHGNARFYKFLLNTCELVYHSLLVDEQSGTVRFRDFVRDEPKMAKLFEAFLRNFIARECPDWIVRRENIAWQAMSVTDPGLDLLPRMQTDISLRRPGQYLIVDAKYYREAFSSYFDSEKIRNANLYQLVSYLLNTRIEGRIVAEGMLLYPQVDHRIREKYEILGRSISVCTVDLCTSWPAVYRELREMFC